MPNEILSLGLPQETVTAISRQLCARIHVARNLGDVISMLEDHDVCCIVVSAAKCPDPVQDITSLLGHTPLTTRIILLRDTPVEIDLGKLAGMGIKTLTAPCDVDELIEKLRR